MPQSKETMKKTKLRIPHVRILKALMPNDPKTHCIDWPVMTRVALSLKAGYTEVSGTVTRALNGIRQGSSSGSPQTGLISLGLVKSVVIDNDGLEETNYSITQNGIDQYLAYDGEVPDVKPVDLCVNDRYRMSKEEV